MVDETVTKRLHVSGLTPALTVDDLGRRLGTFGTVTALDGFGALNALGQPRKFGYVTLETTKPQLQRCMNLLSGSTWKGAKLRIGEAKPDFRDRIAAENKRPSPPSDEADRPAKRARLARGVQGVHAPDMTPLTPAVAATRSGWRVLASGRVIRPVRIRPARPLPLALEQDRGAKKGGKDGGKEKTKAKTGKRKVKPPATRARARTIDPTRWGSVHLKGIFMGGEAGISQAPVISAAEPTEDQVMTDGGEESSDTLEEDEADDNDAPASAAAARDISPNVSSAKRPSPSLAGPQKSTIAKTSALAPSIAQEKTQTLSFLNSLFGNANAEGADWGGRESVAGSDADAHESTDEGDEAREDRVPEVTASMADAAMEGDEETESQDDTEDDDEDDEVSKEQESALPTPPVPAAAPTRSNKLKDLFKPQENEGGFSLVGHLDLDLELGDSADAFPPFLATPPAASFPAVAQADRVLPRTTAGRFTTNPYQTLFFPADPTSAQGAGKRKGPPDPLAAARAVGTHWRTAFVRTESEVEARARWDADKLGLTREWKRRAREAGKSARRRGGGDGE